MRLNELTLIEVQEKYYSGIPLSTHFIQEYFKGKEQMDEIMKWIIQIEPAKSLREGLNINNNEIIDEAFKYDLNPSNNTANISNLLIDACEMNRHDVFVRLFENYDIDANTKTRLALRSSNLNRVEILEYLIEQGLSKTTINNALVYASRKNSIETAKILIENGSDVNFNNCEALYNACHHGYLEMAECLTENGASNEFALIEASIKNHTEVVKYLMESKMYDNGDNALIYAAKHGNIDIVKYLIENGTDIHASKDLALRYAINKNHLEVVKCLMSQGATIKWMFNSVLKKAESRGYLEMVKYLKELKI